MPGPISGVVRIRDASRKIEAQVWDLLYPTFVEGQNATGKAAEGYQVYEGDAVDPWEINFHENEVVSGAGGDDE